MNMARMEMAPEWLTAALVWPAITAQLLCLGSAALVLILLRRSVCHADFASQFADRPSRVDAIVNPLILYWRIFAIANVLFFALLIVDKTAGMAGVAWPQALPLISEVMNGTHAGAVWRWQILVSIALLAAVLIPSHATFRSAAILGLSAALLLMNTLTSHAIDYGRAAIVFDLAHELAAGLWAGALLSCWVITRRHAEGSMIVEHAARILSRLAAWSVGLLIATGIYMSWCTIGFERHELLYSSYSHVLAVKLTVFAIVLSIGAWNRFRLMPQLHAPSTRHQLVRNVGAEAIIIVIVIGLAALLANTSPARMRMQAIAAHHNSVRTG